MANEIEGDRIMARFEDAIQWVMNGGRARRACWADVSEYTRSTPPMATRRRWRIWQGEYGEFFQGWGGQIGAVIPSDDPIKDGTYYQASDDDRLAGDWELFEKKQVRV